MTGTRHISPRSAHAFCVDVLGRLGVPAGEARVCAETLVEASLRGVDSHGISLLGTFAERIHSGQMRPGRRPLVRREGAATALVDGQHGLGPPLARWAVAKAREKAGETGLGAVAWGRQLRGSPGDLRGGPGPRRPAGRRRGQLDAEGGPTRRP